jgi:hypothetical protein
VLSGLHPSSGLRSRIRGHPRPLLVRVVDPGALVARGSLPDVVQPELVGKRVQEGSLACGISPSGLHSHVALLRGRHLHIALARGGLLRHPRKLLAHALRHVLRPSLHAAEGESGATLEDRCVEWLHTHAALDRLHRERTPSLDRLRRG